jgi:hypothetical protein
VALAVRTASEPAAGPPWAGPAGPPCHPMRVCWAPHLQVAAHLAPASSCSLPAAAQLLEALPGHLLLPGRELHQPACSWLAGGQQPQQMALQWLSKGLQELLQQAYSAAAASAAAAAASPGSPNGRAPLPAARSVAGAAGLWALAAALSPQELRQPLASMLQAVQERLSQLHARPYLPPGTAEGTLALLDAAARASAAQLGAAAGSGGAAGLGGSSADATASPDATASAGGRAVLGELVLEALQCSWASLATYLAQVAPSLWQQGASAAAVGSAAAATRVAAKALALLCSHSSGESGGGGVAGAAAAARKSREGLAQALLQVLEQGCHHFTLSPPPPAALAGEALKVRQLPGDGGPVALLWVACTGLGAHGLPKPVVTICADIAGLCSSVRRPGCGLCVQPRPCGAGGRRAVQPAADAAGGAGAGAGAPHSQCCWSRRRPGSSSRPGSRSSRRRRPGSSSSSRSLLALPRKLLGPAGRSPGPLAALRPAAAAAAARNAGAAGAAAGGRGAGAGGGAAGAASAVGHAAGACAALPAQGLARCAAAPAAPAARAAAGCTAAAQCAAGPSPQRQQRQQQQQQQGEQEGGAGRVSRS